MCTVTIIPTENHGFVLTSNRDEAPNRIAHAPEFYSINNTKVLFPKDELSGGTWIGLSEKNRVVCTLNGGFLKHEHQQEYRKSRGIITLDFLIADTISTVFDCYDLIDIEPFTMVIIDWNNTLKFYELVWDGITKHVSDLPLEPRIWSSSTLYNKSMRAERLQWFEDFKTKNALNSQSLLKFHKTTETNNQNYGIVMDRALVKTTSITQIERFNDTFKMYHENLQNDTFKTDCFNFKN